MKVLTAPYRIPDWYSATIFLAGSIEMGEASEWQKQAIDLFDQLIPPENKAQYLILNPRRPDWDSNWKQEYEDPQFSQQVRWEKRGLDQADYVLFYLDPATKSPISLLELGRYWDKSIVVCPEGFWRKGNIDIFCEENDVPQTTDLRSAVNFIIKETQHLI